MFQSVLPTESLAHSLQRAAQVLEAVQNGAGLPMALAQAILKAPNGSRGATQDLAYRAVRHLGSSRALLNILVKPILQRRVRDILLCALALLQEPREHAAYSDFTVVNQAVEAVALGVKTFGAKGLVNAVLRRFLRERHALLSQIALQPEARWNYPQWWIDAVQAAWPKQWMSLLTAGNQRGPMTLRVNTRKLCIDAAKKMLAEEGILSHVVGPAALRLAFAVPVNRLPGFYEGLLSVQDAGAQHAAALVGAKDRMRVLDACAAPGGKSGHLLELADIELLALDRDLIRVNRIYENLERLGFSANVKIGDAGDPKKWWDGQPFDRILADVPCSAAGVVRRHPDIRWLRRPSDIDSLVKEQRRILNGLWCTLARGGQLLYVTCSIFPAENEAQAQWFENAHPDAVRLSAPGQLLMTPDGDHDGFFYARFQKR
ncbi:16S rRNA (cytosine(967)-C(5))-methyltransferase RsmB [Candidatus Pandoraea novymonadis]|uniref:Ribosomal RNA small subunit methyltransferase B n=1 Tax=Candidatus Pandoraea novymonadis TaxID=1808959 RepID=A0ABX5FFD6_9BURK|nr:16S rRNA (cytosine(967)-C(5))-methyltransferase RsmB [Candidatus Pandoraea novymonadis]PSB92435.1 Ribosomal RNA small subunit methyltransferase B [Candidatus Pandoraea novymonadis]